MSLRLSEVVAELAAARRELAFCISQRGIFTREGERMALTIGELDWTGEVMRLEQLLRDKFEVFTGMESGVVSRKPERRNVLLPGCDDSATMTARSRRPTLLPRTQKLGTESARFGGNQPGPNSVFGDEPNAEGNFPAV
jgi:hypothetical protein